MISYVVTTIGRPTLHSTLESIECWPGDEIIVVGNVQTAVRGHVRLVSAGPGRDWGNTERNIGTRFASKRYVSHMDDDDVYAKGTRALLAAAVLNNPDNPTIFRMRLPNGSLLWREKKISYGNIGTPMIFHPNDPEKVGQWRYWDGYETCGDWGFLHTMGWRHDDIAWSEHVIAEIGQAHV